MNSKITIKKLIGLAIILLSFMTVQVVYVSGTGVDPSISLSNLSLRSSSDPLNEATIMIPTQNYQLHFTVTDSDFLNYMYFEVILCQGEYNPENVNVTNQDGSVFGFIWSTGLLGEPEVIYDEGTSNLNSTWSLVSSNVSEFENGLASYEFVVEFKVSKVALATNDWSVNIRVMDDYRDETFPSEVTEATAGLHGLEMKWYGEIQLSSETLTWGSIAYTTTYADLASLSSTSYKIISNGTYDLSAKASAKWAGNSNFTTSTQDLEASLVSDAHLESNSNQTFSLRLNDELSYDLSGAIQLSSDFAYFALDGLKTSEAGSTGQLNVYIQLSEKFRNGLYWGTITLGISN